MNTKSNLTPSEYIKAVKVDFVAVIERQIKRGAS